MTIAKLELVAAVRLKWVRLLTAAFALLAAAAAYSAGAAGELVGADTFPRTTMALMPAALILIPLAAMILGVSGQSAEAGSEPFLFGQPVSRSSVLIGRWLGELAALAGTIVLGFASGAVVIAMNAGAGGATRFAAFVASAVLLAAIFLSIAATIAAATEKRIVALGIATFVWFFFVLLYDGVALSVAGWLTGMAGGRILFGSVFTNPADLVRVVMLFASGTASVLGAAGEAWLRFLGGEGRAIVAATVAIAAWIAIPLGVATLALARRDL
ncbi:MAG TPA: ABC transporter permease [Vicinamibacterales bacterium]|nr:ABC transporter permease [Vicinamibacterales bacterium]